QALSPDEAATRTNWSNCSCGLARLYRLSECETIASKAPQARFTSNPAMRLLASVGLDCRPCGAVGCAGSRVPWLLVAAIVFHRRPVGARRERRRRELREFSRRINDFAADQRQHGFEAFDVFIGDRKVVGREDSQVGELAQSNLAFLAFLGREPCTPDRVEPDRFHGVEPVLFGVKVAPADRVAGAEPVKGEGP